MSARSPGRGPDRRLCRPIHILDARAALCELLKLPDERAGEGFAADIKIPHVTESRAALLIHEEHAERRRRALKRADSMLLDLRGEPFALGRGAFIFEDSAEV